MCCVNEGEQDRKKVRGRECQRVFVSFITQQQFCFFRGHLKLTACLISSGDSLQSASVHVCMLCVCVYVYVFVNGGYTVKTGGVKRSPVRVDDADKRYDGRHCCSEILLKAS